jgi:hypothetical protein
LPDNLDAFLTGGVARIIIDGFEEVWASVQRVPAELKAAGWRVADLACPSAIGFG